MSDSKRRRSAGVLLPVPALPGPYGIGVLGHEARDFVDFLVDGGFDLWQVLPIEHTDAPYSPYKPLSAFAGEPLIIDPRGLFDRGLITGEELRTAQSRSDPYAVDYTSVRARFMPLLQTAFHRLGDADREAVLSFSPFWLDEYALYMALRDHFNSTPWYEWPDNALKMHEDAAVDKAKKDFADDISFYRFVQWIFDEHWKVLKNYANDRGVRIIGDVPFYISEDSAEVWSNRQMFALDENADFVSVAGCPPDYFNSEGQRWGNPIYNWDYLAKTGYKWWVARMKEALYRYDVVRIDHFRGFESYWNIPADCATAKGGYWVKGPGLAPFTAMEKELGKLPVLAENLGDIGPEVEELLEQSGFLGMGVLQFGFMGDPRHLPHNYSEKTAAYTGTHDNTTLLDWIMQLDTKSRDDALFYSGFTGDWGKGGPNCGICQTWIRILYLSKAALVIVPIQDLLGYGRDTRTNIPGTAEGNWRFRVNADAIAKIDTEFYRRLAETSKQFRPEDLE